MNPVDIARSRWRSVRKAVEEQERLQRELTEAGTRLAALQEEQQQAAQDDREAYAAAIAAGKDEPPRKTEQLAVRIEAEQRRVDACVRAVENANAKLDKLRADNRTAWRKDTLAKIAEAWNAYEESIRLLEQRREELGNEVGLHAWVADGVGINPVRDALAGRTAPINGREPVSFTRTLRELDEDAQQIATHLAQHSEEQSAWTVMRRAEALVGRDGVTREDALRQLGHGDWGG